jgi:hypothetical protein
MCRKHGFNRDGTAIVNDENIACRIVRQNALDGFVDRPLRLVGGHQDGNFGSVRRGHQAVLIALKS